MSGGLLCVGEDKEGEHYNASLYTWLRGSSLMHRSCIKHSPERQVQIQILSGISNNVDCTGYLMRCLQRREPRCSTDGVSMIDVQGLPSRRFRQVGDIHGI